MTATVYVANGKASITLKLTDADIRHLHDFRLVFPEETAILSTPFADALGEVGSASVFLRVDPT